MNAMFLLLGDEALYGYHYWTMERVLDKMFNEAAVKFNGAPSSKTLKQMAAPGSDPTCKILPIQTFYLPGDYVYVTISDDVLPLHFCS